VFARLFGKKPKSETLPTTGGRLIYAIGDVHGRLDVLEPLLHDIAADAVASQPAERPLLIFLGDYVDRGPASKGVIDLILRLQGDSFFETVALKGNHEEALLQFIEDPAFGSTWMEHGGGTTLASYGVQPPAQRTDPDAWAKARDAFDEILPAEHRKFYRGLKLMEQVGDYAFVHAGVRPGVPLEEQSERDMLWIRYEFLQDKGPFGKVIVHGHTPAEEAQMLRHRLGIDTGAYATGVLTGVRLHDTEQRLMQAKVKRQFTPSIAAV
jgi:serine/threonine protein phosphatase 1